MRYHGQTTQQFGYQTKRLQVGGVDILQEVLFGLFLLLFIYIEPDGIGIDPAGNDLIYSVKGAATDKEDILGIDLYQLLLGMFPAALWRDEYVRSFQELQQPLLNAFAADVTGDGRIISFTGYFIYFVDIDDTLSAAVTS